MASSYRPPVPLIAVMAGVARGGLSIPPMPGALGGGSDGTTPEYRIISEEHVPIRISIKVEVPHPYTEERVRAISTELRRSEGRLHADRPFVGYHLPGMEIGRVAWATGRFTPDLKVVLIGSGYEGYLAGTGRADAPDVVGVWRAVYSFTPTSSRFDRRHADAPSRSTHRTARGRPLERDLSQPDRLNMQDDNLGEDLLIRADGTPESRIVNGPTVGYPAAEPETESAIGVTFPEGVTYLLRFP